MPRDTMDEWAHDDHYAVLGVSPDASPEQIVRAYRRLARLIHPDADTGNPAAAERFERLAAARDVLTDPVRRAAYDRSRHVQSRRPRPQPAPSQPVTPVVPFGRSNQLRGAAVWAGPVVWRPDRDPGSGSSARPRGGSR